MSIRIVLVLGVLGRLLSGFLSDSPLDGCRYAVGIGTGGGYGASQFAGGWAMDGSQALANGFWLGMAVSATVPLGILWVLERELGKLNVN